MVSVNKSRRSENIKKKVTFSFCTEKNDCSSRLNTDTHGSQFLNCATRSIGRKPVIVTHKKLGVISLPKHCERRDCDVQKTFVRNVEQTLPPQCMLVRKKETAPHAVALLDTKEHPELKTTYKSKYAAPELYSSLCIAKEIQFTANKTELQEKNGIKTAKRILDEKILSKLNFPLEEKLYKDLISLSVSDDELLWKDCQAGSRKEVKFRSRDPEPKLTDFYTPSEGKEFVVVPDPPLSKPEKIRKYNGFSIYERSQQWNSY